MSLTHNFHLMVFYPDDSIANFFDITKIMANKKNCHRFLLELINSFETFALKRDVPDCQNLLDNQNIWINLPNDRETQLRQHTAGVNSDGLVNKFTQLGELDDFIQTLLQLLTTKA